MTAPHPRRRLYLVTPRLDDPAAFGGALEAALEVADIAAVLLRLGDGGERTLIDNARAVAAMVQRREIALLLDGMPELAGRAGADGAHLTGIAAVTAAIDMLKPDRIVGAGGLRSRHDAMLAAEAGADYVMFGDPDRGGGGPPLDAVVERLTWWSELFETPCIGYAVRADEVPLLAQAGADFVALGDWIWTQPLGAAQAVAAAAASLAEPAR